MQIGSHADWSFITMIAQTCTNLFNTLPNVVGIGKSIACQIDLVDIERVLVNPRPKRCAISLVSAPSRPIQDGCIRWHGFMMTSAQPSPDRLLEDFAFQVPQCQVACGHRRCLPTLHRFEFESKVCLVFPQSCLPSFRSAVSNK